MYKKSFAFVLLLATFACVSQAIRNNDDNANNDYVFGVRAATDTLIARELVTQNKQFFQTVTRTYTLNQAGTPRTISYISITDEKKSRGATAQITSGGVGATSVTIRFTSVRGGGIRSQVEIWGPA